MILLASASDLLELITANVTVGSIYVQADWADYNGTTVTLGRTNTAIISNGTTTLVGSPAGGTVRKVKALFVRNNTGVTPTITFRHTDGTTPVDMYQHTFVVNEQVHYIEGVGFYVLDLTAGITGRYLGTTILQNPTTTFTTGPNTHTIFVRVQAGGGAGGGGTGNATQAAVAGGGSAGGYAEKTFAVQPNTAYTCAIGAGGTGVSNATGNAGGISTFTVGGTTVQANGGLGGVGGITQINTNEITALGGASPSVSTGGDLNAGGQPGLFGHRAGPVFITGGSVISGGGGSCIFGAGGNSTNVAGTGNAATVGFGGGGGGGLSNTTGASTGGAGANGVITVDEYS